MSPPRALSRRRGAPEDGDDTHNSKRFKSDQDEDQLGDEVDDISNSDSEDGEGDGDDEDTPDPSYDENTELLPKSAAYDSRLGSIKARLTGIPAAVVSIIEKHGLQSEHVVKWLNSANDTQVIPEPSRIRIGTVGATGMGKSSFINSVTGVPGLVHAVNAGEACTTVVTEISGPHRGQRQKFAVVEIADDDASRDLISGWVDNCIACYCTAEDPDAPRDAEEQEELEKRAGSATETLSSLYCNRAEMSSQEAVKAYFLEHCSNANFRDETIKRLMSWRQESLAEKRPNNASIRYEVDTTSELHSTLAIWDSASQKQGQPAMWPWVHVIMVGVKDIRVLEHLTLIDLPGIDDLHSTRAASDVNVDELLRRYGRTHALTVIVTGIDQDVSEELATDMDKKGEDIGDYWNLSAEQAVLKQSIKKISEKIAARKTRAKRNTQAGNSKKTNEVYSVIMKLEEEKQAAEADLDANQKYCYELLVGARSAWITRRLTDRRRQHLKNGPELRIFCVSNAAYMALKSADTTGALDANGSGLPAVRHFLLACAAPGIIQATEDYVKHAFPAWMYSLRESATSQYTASPTKPEAKERFLRQIAEPQAKVSTIISDYVRDLMHEGKASVSIPIDQEMDQIVEQALQVVQSKSRLHPMIIRAFARRGGTYAGTKTVSYRSLNEQFADGAINAIEWESFMAETKKLSDRVRNRGYELIETIKRTLEERPEEINMPGINILPFCYAKIPGVEQLCSKYQRELEADLRNMFVDFKLDKLPKRSFAQAMAPAYQAIAQDRGTGIRDRSLRALRNRVSLRGSESPFRQMCVGFGQALRKYIMTKTKVLEDNIVELLKGIHQDVDSVIRVKVANEQEKKLAEELVEYLCKAETEFKGLKQELSALKAAYEEDSEQGGEEQTEKDEDRRDD